MGIISGLNSGEDVPTILRIASYLYRCLVLRS